MRQESIPIFVCQCGILCQLSFDHQFLDEVDGVDVAHAVLNNPTDLFQGLVWAHDANSVAVNKNVCRSQELKGFQGCTVRSENSLATLRKSFFVLHQVSNLDDIACNLIEGDSSATWSRKKIIIKILTPSSSILTAWGAGTLRARSLIKSRAFSIAAGSNVFRVVFTVIIPSTKSRVQAMPCFSRARVIRGHYDRQVSAHGELFRNALIGTHCFLQVDFSIFWEEDCEGGFFGKCASDIILALESRNLPLVDVVRIPPVVFSFNISDPMQRLSQSLKLTACPSRVLSTWLLCKSSRCWASGCCKAQSYSLQ